MSGRCKDLTGQRFGKLIVIERAKVDEKEKHGKHAQWLCKCDCGNEVIVPSGRLKSGNTQSCGCLHKETVSKIGKNNLNPNITDEERKIRRNTYEDRAFKKMVFERDDYTCDCCGVRGRNIKCTSLRQLSRP